MSNPTRPTPRRAAARRRARRPADPARKWASYLRRYRPGLQRYVLDGLTGIYGEQRWESRLDPTSELILTILTQNTADVNAEKAFEALRTAYPSDRPAEVHRPGIGWGGEGLSTAPPPDWSMVEHAPLPELIDVIRPGGLGPQKAPRLQATLRHIRETRGDYDLAFLGDMPALEARDWLTAIDGIGKKTASIVLAFCFGAPVMAVDRHVERVSKRIGLLPPKATADQAHDLFLGLLEPDEMYAAHVLLIHHGRAICQAQRPKCKLCPIADRCRFVNPKAP
ncbi:MAG: endonuclease III [Chloroflexota bacterium]